MTRTPIVLSAATLVAAATVSVLTAPPIAARPAAAGATPTTTIRVGASAESVAISPDGRFVYVPNSDSDTVSVVDTATNAVTRTYSTAGYPTRIAVSPDGARLYVTSVFANSLVTMDAASGARLGEVKTGDYPTAVALSPDGTRAYVANSNSEDVAVVDTAAQRVVAKVKLHHLSEAIAVSPDGASVYALGTAKPSALFVIDAATNRLARTIRLGRWSTDVAISPDARTAWVTNSGDVGTQGQALAVDVANGTIATRVAAGQSPGQLATSADGRRVYVTSMGSNIWGTKPVGSNGLVSVIDVTSRIITGSVSATGPGAFGTQLSGLVITPDGSRAYSALGGEHRIAAFTIAPMPATPTQPRSITMRPRGATAAVSWRPPSASGATGVTRYVVVAVPMAEGPGPSSTCVTAGTSCRVTGLMRGVDYLVTVQARNAQGWSPAGTAALMRVP